MIVTRVITEKVELKENNIKEFLTEMGSPIIENWVEDIIDIVNDMSIDDLIMYGLDAWTDKFETKLECTPEEKKMMERLIKEYNENEEDE